MADRKTVAVFMTKHDEVQSAWVEDARAVADRRGLELIEHWAEDDITQLRQFGEYALRKPCDALVILAQLGGPTNLIRDAVSRGKAVVMLNRTSTDMDREAPWSWPRLRAECPDVLVASVLPDPLETGRLQARQIQVLLPAGGHVLYVLGEPATSDCTDRLKGLIEVLAGEGSYTVSTVVGGFRASVAETSCVGWLALVAGDYDFQLDVVAVQGEAMIPGVRRALERVAREMTRPALERCPIIGIDGSPHYLAEVDAGQLTATVVTPLRLTAAVELLADYWEKGTRPADPIVLLPVRSYPSLEKLSPRA